MWTDAACPLSDLPADAFECIVEAVAKRKRPDLATVLATDVSTLCQDALEARRELRTLALVPGQTVEPKHLCTDPNGEEWVYAHVVFGINPDMPGFGKIGRHPLRGNFLYLRAAFDPDLAYETGPEVDHARTTCEWTIVGVWDQLWRNVPENARFVREWEDNAHREAYAEWRARLHEDGHDLNYEDWLEVASVDDDLDRYEVTRQDVLALQARMRDPKTPRRHEIVSYMLTALRDIQHLVSDDEYCGDHHDGFRCVFQPPRPVRCPGRPLRYVRTGPTVQEQVEEFLTKLKALRILLRSIRRQIVSVEEVYTA
jgi:hypothetical protein